MSSNYSLLSRLPVLRLLLPLMAGIVAFDACGSLWLPLSLLILALGLWIFWSLRFKGLENRHKLRGVGFVPLAIVMIAVGWGAAKLNSPTALDLDAVNGKTAFARLETIKYGEKSMTMRAQLLHSIDDNGTKEKFFDTHIVLSTRDCDYALRAGDVVAFALSLNEVANMGNPDEMDYKRYLYNQGIKYRQHLNVTSLAPSGSSPTIFTRAFNVRQQLEHNILNSNISPLSQSMLITMLLGDGDFIDRTIRQDFSLAGISHILALSGLHISILSLIVWFFLFPLDYLRAKKLRLVITIALMLGYCFVTGLSPSVIRSTVMMSLVFLSVVFYRKSSPLNAVATAALIILIFSPFSLYGVGFQLSFITVVSLIVFFSHFKTRFSNRVVNYVMSGLLTSVVAMVLTLILTAYYFNTISTLSVLSNLIILPVVPVFMIMGSVALFMLSCGSELALLDILIDKTSAFIEGVAHFMATLPMSSQGVYVTWVAVVVYYVIIILLYVWLTRRKIKFLLYACVVLALGMLHGLIVDFTSPKKGLVVFNSFYNTPVMYFNHSRALLWVPDVEEDFDLESFKMSHRAFLSHAGIKTVDLVGDSITTLGEATIYPPYARIQDRGYAAVGRGKWKSMTRNDSTDVVFNTIIATKRYHSTVGVLKELFDFDTLLISGGMYNDDLIKLQRECEELKVPCYSIKESGAYLRLE